MAQHIALDPSRLTELRRVTPYLLSYNIEMTEVTGGTFWKPYTPAQIAGDEAFPPIKDFSELQKLMAVFAPVDLYDQRLRALAAALGPVWVRVSGSWATKTYYDFDGRTGGKAPEGFQSVLTEAQWKGVLDFVRAVGAKLLVSVANCEGIHAAGQPWDPAQAKLLFDYSRDYGVPIDAAEFMNEPNMMEMSGAPHGYPAEHFARDQDLFFRFVRENYPGTLLVGPCATGDASLMGEMGGDTGKLMASMPHVGSDTLLDLCREKADVFSYHYYNGISERGSIMGGHWDAADAAGEAYLAVAGNACRGYAPMRDKYCPGAQMWVTESGDAGCGGNTWASTYLDVLRYANELAAFSAVTDGVIFHNTLCSSDYGLLDHADFSPRPNYWLALLWNRLMGPAVYDTGEAIREGVHLYAHSRRDGKDGAVYLLINNSTAEATTVDLPCPAQRYTLSAESLRAPQALLNGRPLAVDGLCGLPALEPVEQPAGPFQAAPASVTFLVV